MKHRNSSLFLVCVMLSMAMDTAQLLGTSVMAFSFILKGGVMVFLMIFPIALLLRKSTYKNLDIICILLLCFIFLSYSLYSDFPADSVTRAIKQLFLTIICLSFTYLLRSNSFRRKDLVLLATVCFVIITPASLYMTFNPNQEHLAQAAGPYTILWLLLFSFLVVKPSDRLLMLLMLLGMLVLLIIMKRGAILCLGIALLTWIILQNRYYPRLTPLLIRR